MAARQWLAQAGASEMGQADWLAPIRTPLGRYCPALQQWAEGSAWSRAAAAGQWLERAQCLGGTP